MVGHHALSYALSKLHSGYTHAFNTHCRAESAGPNLSAVVRELALLVHAAAIDEDYDADRM
eukprot:2966846-Pleurochrysis_carterae.AAC.1